MDASRRPSNTRALLLQTADRIVLRHGAATLTLDAVAREANVSKGGVLYHFPTKDALITAMIERSRERFENFLESRLAELPASPGRWTQAFLDAAFSESQASDNSATLANAGLLAAVAGNMRTLDSLRSHYDRWQSLIEVDGIDPAVGTLVRLAVDGLWLADMLALEPPDAATRADLHIVLSDLIDRSRDDAP